MPRLTAEEKSNLNREFYFAEYGTTINNIEVESEEDIDIFNFRNTTISDMKRHKFSHVYVIEGTHNGNTSYKIGKADRLSERLKTFNVKIPFDIDLICSFYVQDSRGFESYLHSKFSDKRIAGEWFDLTYKDILNIINLGILREQQDTKVMFTKDISELKSLLYKNDKEYIEYLETQLVMNGIDFMARGV